MHHEPHPRPQLQRASWHSLDGAWRFRFDPEARFETPADISEWPLTIQVPFAPESELSGVRNRAYHRVCWYEREFAAPGGEGKLWLHFGAVDYSAKVWVNGHYAGHHSGGHTPFHFDISSYLVQGRPQVVTVRAEDDPHDLSKPRGKQDWALEPHSIWYPRTTGIWQTVWLERTPPTYLDRLYWTAHLERWEIGVEAHVAGVPREGLELKVKLSSGDQLLAEDRYRVIQNEVHRSIALSDPGIDDYRNALLWSPERPTLIDVEVELWCGGERLDTVRSYTALRSTAILRDRFMLNGRPYYLRLVLDQGYWPESLMTAPSDQAYRTDIELVKKMGFNGVRKHQKIESPRFLYWADVMGLLVWEEMPSAYRFTQQSVERIVREWSEVIDRDRSHPCIIVWVPFNESWGVPDLAEKAAHRHCVQALYHLTKTLDPTRPVVGNDGWESVATDILGIHDYENDAKKLSERYGTVAKLDEILHLKRPGGRVLTVDGHPHTGQPLMLTEFGGAACADDPSDEKGWGYALHGSAEDFKKGYARLLSAVNALEVFSGFCYTQFTDTFQEKNGLLFGDRRPKFPLEEMAAATRGLLAPDQNNQERD